LSENKALLESKQRTGVHWLMISFNGAQIRALHEGNHSIF
jgi:hypothetical protein